MTPTHRLAAFSAVVATVFGGAAVAGGAIGANPPNTPDRAKPEHGGEQMKMAEAGGGHGEHAPAGLSIADQGYRLELADSTFRARRTESLRFRIVDSGGSAIRDFETEHGAKLHLIVVRRDLTGYQHLHPRLGADGTWSVPLTLGNAGSYRIYADFHAGGKDLTLGADLSVPGDFQPHPLPAQSSVAKVDGYTVGLTERSPGALKFAVRRGGREITDLQPYLGARGHLVALREGDLAYLHVHPREGAMPGAGISFMAEYPSASRYRLFLQFKHDGRVHTAAFTREVTR